MTAIPWLPLIAKALATALMVVSASVAAEALGPVWGAIIISLPISAGATYVFLAMQHGADFVAASALTSTAGNAVTGLFLMTYGVLAGRLPSWCGLGAAIGVWLAASFALQQVAWTPVSAAALNLAVYGPGLILFSHPRRVGAEPAHPARHHWFDLPARAMAVAAFVSAVVAVSSALGPAATGVAAVFPISFTSLMVILQARLGGPATARVATNAFPPMLGFGVMLLVLHLTILPLGVWAALGLALAVCTLWSGVLILRQSGAHFGRSVPKSARG